MKTWVWALVAVCALALVARVRAEGECKSGWERYELYPNDVSCYLFIEEIANRQNSLDRCQDEAATLVSILTEEENTFVATQMKSRGFFFAWIGAVLDTNGLYYESGEAIQDNWNSWAKNQPINYGNPTGVFLHNSGEWYSNDVNAATNSICETKAQPTANPQSADCFNVTLNTHAYGAEMYPTIGDLEECLDKCLEVGCKSLDWDRNDTRCWIFTAPRRVEASETSPMTGVDHYSYHEGSVCIPPA